MTIVWILLVLILLAVVGWWAFKIGVVSGATEYAIMAMEDELKRPLTTKERNELIREATKGLKGR